MVAFESIASILRKVNKINFQRICDLVEFFYFNFLSSFVRIRLLKQNSKSFVQFSLSLSLSLFFSFSANSLSLSLSHTHTHFLSLSLFLSLFHRHIDRQRKEMNECLSFFISFCVYFSLSLSISV